MAYFGAMKPSRSLYCIFQMINQTKKKHTHRIRYEVALRRQTHTRLDDCLNNVWCPRARRRRKFRTWETKWWEDAFRYYTHIRCFVNRIYLRTYIWATRLQLATDHRFHILHRYRRQILSLSLSLSVSISDGVKSWRSPILLCQYMQ